MSVVFDFNASLNDVAPMSLISFPVNALNIEKNDWLTNDFGVRFIMVTV